MKVMLHRLQAVVAVEAEVVVEAVEDVLAVEGVLRKVSIAHDGAYPGLMP
jgi:hypothetical protein